MNFSDLWPYKFRLPFVRVRKNNNGLHTRFLLGVSLFLVVLLCLFVQVMVLECWCVLILPVLIDEGSEIGLGS